MEYSYVVLGSSSDLYKFSYSDFKKTDYAYYIPGIESNLSKIGFALFRIHTWKKLNSIVNIPLKHVWNKFLLGQFPVRDEHKICFVFFSNWVEYENQLHLIDYLRKKYVGCKVVWFLQDIISTRTMADGRPLPIEELKKKFDLVFSFDQNDCQKYGFIYHHLVFSSFDGEIVDMPYSDVYFVGKAKNRQSDIIRVFEVFRANGLKCDFHIAGVPKEEQKYADEIDYAPQISYQENLQHIIHTKCLLEIMQQGGAGFTQRGCEAVCFNKKLLTNNQFITEAPFYNEHFICKFTNPSEIDAHFIEMLDMDENVDYHYKEHFSPLDLLCVIEDHLLGKG